MMDRGRNEDPVFTIVTVCVFVYLFLCPYSFCTWLLIHLFNNIYLAQQSCAVDRRPSPNRCEPGSDTSCPAGPAAASPAPESCPDMGTWNTWDRKWKNAKIHQHSGSLHTWQCLIWPKKYVKEVYLPSFHPPTSLLPPCYSIYPISFKFVTW